MNYTEEEKWVLRQRVLPETTSAVIECIMDLDTVVDDLGPRSASTEPVYKAIDYLNEYLDCIGVEEIQLEDD